MNISQKTIWLAVHAVFRAREVGVGGCLLLQDVMDGWVDCRLRQSDLGTGLESLAATGHLRLEDSLLGPRVRLIDDRFGLQRDTAADRQAAADLNRIRELRRGVPASTGATTVPAAGRRREDLLASKAVAA